MANWNHKLNIKDLWEKGERGEIRPTELGELIAQRIRETFPERLDPSYGTYDWTLNDIVIHLDSVTGWDDTDDLGSMSPMEEFDLRMNELYDWADRKRVWIATKF